VLKAVAAFARKNVSVHVDQKLNRSINLSISSIIYNRNWQTPADSIK